MKLSADFSSQGYFRAPAAEIAKLRAAGPLVAVRYPIVGDVWTTTTQDLTDQVLKDDEKFTLRKDDGAIAGIQWWMPGILRTLTDNMLSMDEPDHSRLRDISTKPFVAAPSSIWSRASWRSPTNWPTNYSRQEVQPISSIGTQESYHRR
jgi:cytochrome P450